FAPERPPDSGSSDPLGPRLRHLASGPEHPRSRGSLLRAEINSRALLEVERCQELIGNRSPPAGKESQQMTIARNTVQQLEARATRGCGKSSIIFADQSFLVEPVIVRVEPELRHLVRGALACLRIEGRGERCIRVPAAGEIDDGHDLGWLEAGVVHGEKPAPRLP